MMQRLPIFLFSLLSLCCLCVQAQPPFAFARPSREADLSFAQGGLLEELLVQEGEQVEQGQLLARVTHALLRVEQDIAQEQITLLEKRFAELEKLQAQQRLSPQEFERAKVDLRIARLEQTRIEKRIEQHELKAPFSGLITRIHLEEAEQALEGGPPVMTLVALDPLHIEFHIPAPEAASLRQGAPQQIRLDDERLLTGTLLFISPLIDPASQTRRVRVELANPKNRIPSGSRCRWVGTETPQAP